MKTWHIVGFIGTTVALAAAILLILFTIVQYESPFPILVLLLHLMAPVWPLLCANGYGFDTGTILMDEDSYEIKTFQDLGWFFLGAFGIFGYAVPILMYRAGSVEETAVYFMIVAGTCIWISIIILMRMFLFRRNIL